VTLSYRKKDFFRLKARNESNIRQALHEGKIKALFSSQVLEIEAKQVKLKGGGEDESEEIVLPNDEVFVFAGGIPPFGLLEEAGVSFDPNDRPPETESLDRTGGLMRALSMTLVCALGMIGWGSWHFRYYGEEPALRPGLVEHAWLRPDGAVGLSFGLVACVLFLWNLAYLVRKSPKWGSRWPGSIRLWMSMHVFTGLVGFLCVLIHSGFSFKNTVGGHAFMALGIVVVTGSIGRYLYALAPRAASGAVVNLEELQSRLATLSGDMDRDGRGFGGRVAGSSERID